MMQDAKIFNQLTRFELPWPHYVVDNFLDQSTFNNLIKLKEHSLFQQVDLGVTLKHPKYSLPIQKDFILKEQIENCVRQHLHSILPEKYYCIPDLIKCVPNYVYGKHKDHKQKAISIVVYLWPKMSNATILVHNKKDYHMEWKPNRALIFKQEEHGYHYYVNKTIYPRLTLNVYITTDAPVAFNVTINNLNNEKV